MSKNYKNNLWNLRRYSRSPRRDRRRDRSRSSSKPRDRRSEKADVKSDKNNKSAPEKPSTTKKSTVTTGKKLPFIGRMPVFKKQSTGRRNYFHMFCLFILHDSIAKKFKKKKKNNNFNL